jgi:hypothetical protein
MTELKLFRKKPPIVQAVQWTGQDDDVIDGFLFDHYLEPIAVYAHEGVLYFELPKGRETKTYIVSLNGYVVFDGRKVKAFTEEQFKEKYEAL